MSGASTVRAASTLEASSATHKTNKNKKSFDCNNIHDSDDVGREEKQMFENKQNHIIMKVISLFVLRCWCCLLYAVAIIIHKIARDLFFVDEFNYTQSTQTAWHGKEELLQLIRNENDFSIPLMK